MQLATRDRRGPGWLGPRASFGAFPFLGLRFLAQVLLWHAWRGGGLVPGSLKTGLGSSGGRLATTCSSARNALCPEQDVPSDVPEAFFLAR